MVGDTIVSILRRLLDSSQGNLSPAIAEAVLSIQLSDVDQARIAELAVKSTDGMLSPAEAAEYDGFITAADLLSLWKSKARLSLTRRTSAA